MALAHYVQALGAFPHGTGSPEAVEALSKELAAPGEKTPNRIPVSMAMARLVQEFSAPPPLAVAPEDHSPGAELIRQVVIDPSRAARDSGGIIVLALRPEGAGREHPAGDARKRIFRERGDPESCRVAGAPCGA